MATTWVGGDGTGAQQNDSSRGANWSTGSVPGSGDDVVIANVTHHCILATSYTWGSLEIETSAELEASSEKTITIDGEISNYGVKNDGIVTGDINLILTFYTNASLIKLNGSSGNFNDVTLNHANADYETTSAATIDGDFIITAGTIHIGGTLTVRGNLTITAGELNTKRSGTDYDLQVDGNTSLGAGAGAGGADEATLTCNSSDLYLGSGYSSDYGLYVKRGGTFVGGTGPHIIGSISMEDYATAKLTLTTHASGTTLNAGDYGSDFPFTVGSDSTVTSTNSLVVIATSKSESTYSINAHNKLNDLTINSSGKTISLGQATTLAGNLTITAGTFDTTTSNYALTVTGDIEIADGGPQLKYNDSTVTCARLGVGLGGVGEIDGTEAGKIIVNGTGNVRILDLAGAVLTGDTVTFEYQGQATTATQALSGLTSGVFNLIVNSDGATEKCIPNASVTSLNDLTLTDGEFELPSSTNIEAVGDLIIQANGVADLNPASSDGNVTFRSVVISSGGTLEAPSHGSFTLTGTLSAWSFQNNSTNFNHNNGTITQTAAGHIKSVSTNPFYNFTMNSSSSDSHEAVFRASSGTDTVIAANDVTVTRGIVKLNTVSDTTSMASLTIGSTGTFQASSGTTTITGALILASSGTLTENASGLITCGTGTDIQQALTTVGNWTLTGDCEFDAVTVSSGDTLDLNGNRAVFDGDFTLASGTPVLKLADSMFICTGDVEWNGKVPTSSANTILWHNVSGEKTWRSNYSEGTFFCDGTPSTAATKVHSYAWNQTYTDKLIVGTGIFNNDSINIGASTKIAVADGGNFTAGGSSIIDSAGTISFSGGLIGKSALDLTGSEEVTGSDNLDEVATTNRVTVEAWFKATTDDNYRGIFSRGNSWATGNIYMYMNDAGNIQFSMHDFGGTVTSTTAGLADGKWHHAAATYDQTTCKIYIDGKLDASAAHTNAINTQTNGFKIGDRDAQNWVGQIGRVSIWKSALSETLIRKMMFMDWTTMAADSDFTDSDAIGWWQFDEGTSTDVGDSSSQSNDGTLNSAAWVGEGEYSKASSTIKTTANGAELWLKSGVTDIYNLDIDGNTTISTIGGSNFKLMGDLDVAASKDIAYAGQIKLYNAGKTFTFGTPATAVKDITSFSTREAGTFTIPEVTINKLFMDTADSIVVQSGDHTYNAELEINADTTFNTDGNKLTSKLIDMNGTGTLNINNSTLKFSATDGLTSTSTNTLSAGPTTTIEGNSKASKSTFESQNNFIVVGNVSNLNVTNEELKVSGNVTDCTGLIHQMNPTQDADQQLDKDTADDRDVQFASLNMDRNTELVG